MEITRIYYLHEIGAKKNQEDYLWPVPPAATPDDRIFIVCDGVGGSGFGEVASKIVAETVGTGLLRLGPGEISLPTVDELLEKARKKLVDYAMENGEVADMATTFTLLYLTGDKAFISWLGDSRVYHLGQHEVLFKTEDHSLVNSLVRNGQLTAEEARTHPQKNLLLKAVRAGEADPHAEGHWVNDIRDGDHFLLCTDGLLENVTDADLFTILEAGGEDGGIDAAFRRMCEGKTKDNYSLYLIDVQLTRTVSAGKKVSPGHKRRRRMVIGLSTLALLLLLSAGVFFMMFKRAPKQAKIEEMVPITTDSVDELGNSEASAWVDSAKMRPDSVETRLDSAKARLDSVKTLRDSVVVHGDSVKARHDSVKARHDSVVVHRDSAKKIHADPTKSRPDPTKGRPVPAKIQSDSTKTQPDTTQPIH
jgi:serine/threonine protein phosphatase PrpC